MPTYVPTAVALVDILLPSDGTNIDAADVNDPMQELGDGIVHLQERTDVLANLAALTAITTPTNGLVRFVKGCGTYSFDTASADPVDTPFVLNADDLTTGQWLAGSAMRRSAVRTISMSRVAGITVNGASGALLAYSDAGSLAASFGPMTQTNARINLGSMATREVSASATLRYGYIIPLSTGDLVDGALLTSGVLRYFINQSHVALPANLPSWGVVRKHKDHATGPNVESMLSTTNGLSYDTSADLAAYESAGTSGLRTLTFTPDQFNVIDVDTYSYAIYVFDEADVAQALEDNQYFNATLTFSTAR